MVGGRHDHRQVLRQLRSDATLIAIEMNPDFVRHLSSSLNDRRLRVVEALRRRWTRSCGGSVHACRLHHLRHPFSCIPRRCATITQDLRRARTRGAFLVYQFSTRVLQD
jgi:phospholipid N-methyltransferase